MTTARPRFDLVLFDLDGTLADTGPDIAAAFNAALERHGCAPVEESDVVRCVGGGVRALVERLRPLLRPAPPEVDALAETFLEYYRRAPVVRTRLYPGVAETLPAIPARKAVVSNKPADLSEEILRRLGVRDHFIEVVGGDTYPRKKPDPQPLRETIRRWGARSALMVGDGAADVAAACAAGCAACAVLYGYGAAHDDLSAADFRIRAFAELLDILR